MAKSAAVARSPEIQEVTFQPRIVSHTCETLAKPLPIATLAAEPSLFSMTIDEVKEHGGVLAREALNSIFSSPAMVSRINLAKDAGLHEVIDVRVQRLMPGMFPSIPGWHCDAVPRDGYHGQPEFAKIHPDSVHFTCIASTDESGVSATEFALSPFSAVFNQDTPIWQQLHRQMTRRGWGQKILTDQVRNGQILMFDTLTPHRTMPCTVRGWRMFFRLSMYHAPALKGAIANQQQVYLLSEENGW
jgi:hypothetical protein